MIKTITSLFALYGLSSSQAPPAFGNIPPHTAPNTPTKPVVPITPVNPEIRVNPELPAVPATPAIPTEPSNPAIPVNPEIPAIPATPTEPILPEIPAVPATPTEPLNPTIPVPYNPQPTEPTLPVQSQYLTLPEGYIYGAFGQICAIPSIDAQCKFTTDYAVDSEFMKCERNYDCCLCSTVQCTDCNLLSVGNSGLFGVQSVLISGRDIEAGGADIFCKGTESCTNSIIQASNVKGIECSGSMGCQGATITIFNPANHFYLNCIGLASCQDLKIQIIIPALFTRPEGTGYCDTSMTQDKFKIDKIACGGQASCAGLDLSITNDGCKQVEIEHFDCLQHDACTGARFNFIGNVDIGTCQCGESCQSVTGIERCFDNLEYLFCPDPISCKGAVNTIVNPVNGFILKCAASNSCQGAVFTIELNSLSGNVDMFDGLMCKGPNACNGATFIIDNQQLSGNAVKIEKIECSSIGSCMDTTFMIGENVNIEQIYCNPGSCDRCVIKIDPNVAGIPCDPTQVEAVQTPPQLAVVPAFVV